MFPSGHLYLFCTVSVPFLQKRAFIRGVFVHGACFVGPLAFGARPFSEALVTFPDWRLPTSPPERTGRNRGRFRHNVGSCSGGAAETFQPSSVQTYRKYAVFLRLAAI